MFRPELKKAIANAIGRVLFLGAAIALVMLLGLPIPTLAVTAAV